MEGERTVRRKMNKEKQEEGKERTKGAIRGRNWNRRKGEEYNSLTPCSQTDVEDYTEQMSV